MDSSDVCPTEDAIRALLENLVDPLLPFKPSSSDVPSKALCESVAKQVHAVVLLYNYYHRREHPHLQSLSCEAFRSLATVMRPALLQHFKFMKESSESRQDGDLEHTALLEQFIADACNLSMSLNASSDLSNLEKWPIKKVAVLLVDSKKMNCYLQHSLITQGVWSLLEKSTEQKKTTAAEDQYGNQVKNDDVIFQKAAFSAIKEATGVNPNNIVILERHLVYSLSEANTAVCFYIMKCTSEDSFPGPVPIEEVLNCMQGPLFERIFSEWATNPTVEYFHVLPYASIIADCFSRREDTENVIEKEAEAIFDYVKSDRKTDAANESEVSEENAALRTKDTNVKKAAATLAYPKARKKTTPRILKRNSKGRENFLNMLISGNKPNTSQFKEIYANGEKCGFESEFDPKDDRERGSWKKKTILDAAAHDSNINLDKLQTTLLSKATLLSKTALQVLLHKRDKLTLQQREIEDEIAKCDKCIQNIKGDPELQLDTILECCNDAYPRRIAQDTTTLQQPHDKPSAYKRMKVCESLPPTKSSCQKLDDICVENDWMLPDYSVSPLDGGFIAQVRIKETHFARSTSGEERPETQEARESAASCLLTKIHNFS